MIGAEYVKIRFWPVQVLVPFEPIFCGYYEKATEIAA